MTTFYVNGTLRDKSKRPLKDLTVRLVRYLSSKRKITISSSVKTNSKGQFKLSFQHKIPLTHASKVSPFEQIRVQVYDPKGKLLEEISPKAQTATVREVTVEAYLDYTTAPPPPKDLSIRGTITLDNGRIPRQFSVEAVDQDLRREEVLGMTVVSNTGAFRISYSTADILRGERGSADLFIRVYDAQGNKVGQSNTLFNAPANAVIDLKVSTTKSVVLPIYEAIEQALPNILEDLPITQLEQNADKKDLDFLAAETGFLMAELTAFVLGHHLEQKSDIPAQFWFVLLQQNNLLASNSVSIPQQLQNLELQFPGIDSEQLTNSLKQGIEDHQIDSKFDSSIKNWADIYENYVLQLNKQSNQDFSQNVIKKLGIKQSQKQNKLSKLLFNQTHLSFKTIQSLKQDVDLQPKEIQQIQNLYKIREITRGNFDLVNSIQNNYNIEQPEQLRQLAKLDAPAWTRSIERGTTTLPFDTKDLDKATRRQLNQAYGETLKLRFAQAYPSMSFVGDLERYSKSDNKLYLQHSSTIQAVIERDSKFDLINTPIDSYIQSNPLLQKNPAAQLELKAVQRVFKIVPNFNAVNSLLENKVHSAQQIYRTGRSNFVQAYKNKPGFDLEIAHKTWDQAEAIHAATTSLVAELQQLHLAKSLHFLPLDADFSDFPNWENLFQGGDSCACQHCQSVYSPSAYFSDLMLFLSDRRGKNVDDTLKNLLLERRPDLGYLELSCANANTMLPYVDVVNEVLEAAVAGDAADMELAGIIVVSNSDENRTNLENAFEVLGTPLDDNYDLSQIGTTTSWVIHSSSITYLLVNKGGQYFARILPNTKQSSALLRARPQYVNPVAYERLQEAVYPAILPFDLNKEKLDASFGKLKQQRWKLLETFQSSTRSDNPTEEEITAVYLGIAVNKELDDDEWRIITQQRSNATQHRYWGSANNLQLTVDAKNVRKLLDHTHLSYNDLLILLDLPFTNPAQALSIEHPEDGSCDLDRKRIQGFTISILDRWHRFLRFWRKVSLEMWEVDALINHPAVGQGQLNANCLVQIRYVLELQKQLDADLSIAQVLTLLGDIPSRTIFVELHKKRKNALYQDLFLNPNLVKEPDTAFELSAVTASPPTAIIEDHILAILAGLRLTEPHLEQFLNMRKASDNSLYIPLAEQGVLSLENLSFLYRQKIWSSSLQQSANDWVIFLQVYGSDVDFSTAKDALDFLAQAQRFFNSGLTPHLATYVLQADTTASVAPSEANVAKVLNKWRRNIQEIRATYDNNQYDFLQATPLSDTASLEGLVRSLLEKANRSEDEITQIFALLSNTAPSGSPEQRLPLKFVQPVFTIRLHRLPDSVEFNDLTEDLAARLAYDKNAQELTLTGFISTDEQNAVRALSTDTTYQQAIDDLADQALTGTFEPWQLWLDSSDLDFAAANFYNQHLATAANKLLAYWVQKDSRVFLTTELSSLFGWPAVLSLLLIQQLQVPVGTGSSSYLEYLLGDFADSSDGLSMASHPSAFNGLYWLDRVYQLGIALHLSPRLWYWLEQHGGVAQTLDWSPLPLTSADTAVPITGLLTLVHFLELERFYRASLISDMWTILAKLDESSYTSSDELVSDLAAALGATVADVEGFVLLQNLTLPDAFLQVGVWQNVQEALEFAQALGSSVSMLLPLTIASPEPTATAQLEQLLQAKYGESTWITLQTEMEDILRGRKRDALVAYLLAQEPPADAPSGKWQNSNDLYAYYLLDVQMGACMQTSRLVQGSGSIQLFVQRCFLGLEPKVMVNVNGDQGDSAWNWWKWMRKYRVWEANRKVFLYPENWTAPELRPDRSDLFKQMEKQLLQAEMTDEQVKKVFTAYLEQLTEIAHLEVAAYYHEDRGDESILHVFGRTESAPRMYYYRTYDYREWTPWEKVEAGIMGDHLIPFVVNGQLHLYWPEFMVVPVETGEMPAPEEDADGNMDIAQTVKQTELRLAFVRYQNGKWTPKQVSEDVLLSAVYVGDLDLNKVRFHAIDLTEREGTLGIRCKANNVIPINQYHGQPNGYYDERKMFDGFFDLAGPQGLPSLRSTDYVFEHRKYPRYFNYNKQSYIKRMNRAFELRERNTIDYPNGDTLSPWVNSSIIDNRMDRNIIRNPLDNWQTYFGHNLSYFDKLIGNYTTLNDYSSDEWALIPMGAWLPFSYGNQEKKYWAFPLRDNSTNEEEEAEQIPAYYPLLKQQSKKNAIPLIRLFQIWADSYVENAEELSPNQRRSTINFMRRAAELRPKESVSLAEFKHIIEKEYIHVALGLEGRDAAQPTTDTRYHFIDNYHPFANDFLKLMYDPREGIESLMRRETQLMAEEEANSFDNTQNPTDRVYGHADNNKELLPQEQVDFAPNGSYSVYNWELFYHAPLLIANSLSSNQRFEEAMKWYHYIFNPLGLEGTLPDGSEAGVPNRFWITKPFFLKGTAEYQQERIDSILNMLAGNTAVAGYSSSLQAELERQVADWRKHPFEPHRVAQYRTVAYQKNVFMKYLDNLIAWGDQLFRQDSMESVNEAIQLYILAAELLGSKPQSVPSSVKPSVASFNELEDKLGAFANAIIQVENYIPPSMLPTNPSGGNTAPIPTLYFCIPENDKLLAYWDVVADRLYKIRNCMNIDGIKRSLSLFEPAIDPGALVNAVGGAGGSFAAALADQNAPLPYYRFPTLLKQANQVCEEVRLLGEALLYALEKKDAEELALLRNEHESKLQDLQQSIADLAIEELTKNLDALQKKAELIEARRDYYAKKKLSDWLVAAASIKGGAVTAYAYGAVLYTLSSPLKLAGTISTGAAGVGGSPVAQISIGPKNAGDAMYTVGKAFKLGGEISMKIADLIEKIGKYKDKQKKWAYEVKMANKELPVVEKQIEAAQKALERAEEKAALQAVRFEQAQAIGEFMTQKYTQKDLYQWLTGELSQLYFKRYQLAYDLAKKAERCYRFELGLSHSSIVKFGHWNSLKKGLLSGEKLQYQLRKLEEAYVDNNRRELELTKHFSLAQWDPFALHNLREEGSCLFELDEALFDLDYPGHYFRRIKSVSLSIPCGAGQYTTIACTLTLTENYIRTSTEGEDYARQEEGDTRFVSNNLPIKSIATSHANKDCGLFEMDFKDERYLPFEGAGAVSKWQLTLFTDERESNNSGKKLRQFDYGTIEDAVLHVNYTARAAGGLLKNKAIAAAEAYFESSAPNNKAVLVNLKDVFVAAWSTFHGGTLGSQVFTLPVSNALLPYIDQQQQIKVNAVQLFVQGEGLTSASKMQLTLPVAEAPADQLLSLAEDSDWWLSNKKDTSALAINMSASVNNWEIRPPAGMDANDLEEILVLIEYQWS